MVSLCLKAQDAQSMTALAVVFWLSYSQALLIATLAMHKHMFKFKPGFSMG